MKKNLVLIFLMVVCNTVFAGEIYKCTIKGAVTYQAKPCSGTGSKLNIPQAYRSNTSKESIQEKTSDAKESDAAKKAGLAIAQEAYQMTKNR
ncbi:hypothetical protein ACN19N_07165 [Acinetobacter sp. LF10]|uniref:hypothetical protein n=1 Tax=unclassified Acinetobacter TaxID=196816 RepID=UPI0022AC601B|nr:hypothetical protein [Acinetobacter sp. TR3]WAU77831.1 hypothetical protein O1449_06660 [Acinetobacter sp. TR3]